MELDEIVVRCLHVIRGTTFTKAINDCPSFYSIAHTFLSSSTQKFHHLQFMTFNIPSKGDCVYNTLYLFSFPSRNGHSFCGLCVHGVGSSEFSVDCVAITGSFHGNTGSSVEPPKLTSMRLMLTYSMSLEQLKRGSGRLFICTLDTTLFFNLPLYYLP